MQNDFILPNVCVRAAPEGIVIESPKIGQTEAGLGSFSPFHVERFHSACSVSSILMKNDFMISFYSIYSIYSIYSKGENE